jgi:hypothetical protein
MDLVLQMSNVNQLRGMGLATDVYQPAFLKPESGRRIAVQLLHKVEGPGARASEAEPKSVPQKKCVEARRSWACVELPHWHTDVATVVLQLQPIHQFEQKKRLIYLWRRLSTRYY